MPKRKITEKLERFYSDNGRYAPLVKKGQVDEDWK